MIKKSFFIILLIFITSSAFAVDKTVAVMNFKNYGGNDIKFLSKSIPDAIESSITDMKGLRVVERRQLSSVLDEIALSQSGIVNRNDVRKVGRVSGAEILVIGTVAGNSRNVIVTLKAVQVKNGRILYGKQLRSPIAQIFNKASMEARALGAIISGRGTGKISLSTIPSGGDIYIDGVQVGTTPLIEHRVTIGEHRIKVVKDGFLDYEVTVTIRRNGHERINATLIAETLMNRNEIGVGIFYLVPSNENINPGFLFNLFYARSFGFIQPGIEFAVSGSE